MTTTYTPAYLAAIGDHLADALQAVNNALDSIETSVEYCNSLHSFHVSAVVTYNALVSMKIRLEKMGA